MAHTYTLDTLARGLTILSLFSRQQPALTMTEIAAITGINKTTVFRIVNTFEEAGYLVRDSGTKRYRPGIKVLQLGFTAISSLDVRQVARPYLEQLSQQTGETVSLSILDGMEVVYIDRVRNRQIMGVVLGLGSRLPAHCASMGKAMLAFLPENELQNLLDQADLRPCTPKSISDQASLEHELSEVRRLGYALNNEELELGLRAVAAPVWDGSGRAAAAINVTGMAASISLERLTGELARAAQDTAWQISRALGYSGERAAKNGF